MKKQILVLMILVLCAAAAFAGCTGPTGTPAQPAATAGAPAAAQAPASAQNNLVTEPTDVVPDNNYVSVIVQEKEYTGKIPVVFDGGKGLYMMKSAKVTLYRSDGQVMTADLGIKKGDLVYMEGTKQTDRVVVHVSQMNGYTYKVADVLSPYRTR